MKTTTLVLLVTLAVSCNSPSAKDKSVISDKEKHICDSLKIDASLVHLLRQYTNASIEPFHYSLSKEILPNGTEKELDPVYLQGIVFKETTANTEIILNNLHNVFMTRGYSLFVLDKNYGISNTPDVMGILKTTDKYEVLKSIKTNGINYDIDSDSLTSIIKIFDNKYSLDLIGASGEWCEFKINNEPTDWLSFAQEAYDVCPDIVDQGSGSVEALAKEMKKTKRLFFWWD